MRKVLPALVLIMLIAPAVLSAQGVLKVSSVYGPVEWKPVSAKAFSPLTASVQSVQVGDELIGNIMPFAAISRVVQLP